MPITQQWELRAEFARRLSHLYGKEVPAYTTLLEVSQAVNDAVLSRPGSDTERLGSIARVTAERHGAIRVGTPQEMAQVARVFAAMGMHPVGFYDLREAAASSVPVVSTAFRPTDPEELARNPFRVFTSMLVPADRRFFSADLQRRLESFLARRTLFTTELLVLADRASEYRGLNSGDAEMFLTLATAAFTLSTEAVDRAWYRELEQVSSVAADIGGVTSTHINHLTPRVLDIDDLYARMERRSIDMIDTIQGPPLWAGPDLLLRQTSFRALAEPRVFRDADGRVEKGSLRVRFGEVEARGIAATVRGRKVYDRLAVETDQAVREAAAAAPVSAEARNAIAAELWNQQMPATERGLALHDLAYFTYTVNTGKQLNGHAPSRSLPDLIDQGWVRPEPIVYEDFLPKSAAGIFQSNLTSDGRKDTTQSVTAIDAAWMEGVLNRTLHDPYDLYDGIRRASLDRVATELHIRGPIEVPAPIATPPIATQGVK
ncbi:2-oxoadipate dioxygenase/decarboxylase [Rhodococcus sp. T2V]|uniref:2-oxoadipate dioxygenase/decarboxylase n=1 Tax=Rhodococcus sp. T2V TaxID=3034164 RepID=UPI0023E21071|nr:VOC family protein [Rhodococcus sp. T2V]MDF3304497.1 VOC family protein [Rhodococcus sp. T2V]